MKENSDNSTRFKSIKSSLRNASAARVPHRVTFADIKKSSRRSLFQSSEDLTSKNDPKKELKESLSSKKEPLKGKSADVDATFCPRQTRSATKKATKKAALLKR